MKRNERIYSASTSRTDRDSTYQWKSKGNEAKIATEASIRSRADECRRTLHTQIKKTANAEQVSKNLQMSHRSV